MCCGTEAWINQRLKSIEVRKELTDEWKRCGVTTQQYASLTDIVTMAWSGKSTRSYKAHKGLTKQNLRDPAFLFARRNCGYAYVESVFSKL